MAEISLYYLKKTAIKIVMPKESSKGRRTITELTHNFGGLLSPSFKF